MPQGMSTVDINRILFATDFSDCSNGALEAASRLASGTGARLFIVHIDGLLEVSIPSVPAGADDQYDAPWGYERREVRERLENVVPTVANVAYEHCYLKGFPVAELLKCADSKHVDMIVMGSHGRSGISRLIMGSVAEGVMRRANCPVLIVKSPSIAANDLSNAIATAAQH